MVTLQKIPLEETQDSLKAFTFLVGLYLLNTCSVCHVPWVVLYMHYCSVLNHSIPM